VSAHRPDRRALGAEGERLAAAHLTRHGWRVLARNARAGGVELDLVAARRDVVAFVEVKTRRSPRFGPGELAVDGRKRGRLLRGAAAWLRENPTPPGCRVRFDVIVCEQGPDGAWRLRHLEAAFDAGG
jgi:putative endonuclease